ncbi:hypothetical protein FM110_09985 [Brachybacterium nesterenkovii]|uniref:Uncharacterized protein n=1 Tax=Brachybacterium nesterenkovii TaxID=47847 RepID=A0A1X6X430_9MICO|nr:hypothetical protein FM110_09985 [Brachybacterium nesterenkovii]
MRWDSGFFDALVPWRRELCDLVGSGGGIVVHNRMRRRG